MPGIKKMLPESFRKYPMFDNIYNLEYAALPHRPTPPAAPRPSPCTRRPAPAALHPPRHTGLHRLASPHLPSQLPAPLTSPHTPVTPRATPVHPLYTPVPPVHTPL